MSWVADDDGHHHRGHYRNDHDSLHFVSIHPYFDMSILFILLFIFKSRSTTNTAAIMVNFNQTPFGLLLLFCFIRKDKTFECFNLDTLSKQDTSQP